jgi:lipoprotein-releasing system permease protein
MPPSGWVYRRMKAAYDREFETQRKLLQPQSASPAESSSVPADPTSVPADPVGGQAVATVFDPATEQFTGIVLGIAIGSVRQRNPEGKVLDYYLCRPGDDVEVTFPSAGTPPKAISDKFTVIDFYESKMSEYDSGFAFVPLKKLQQMRGMIDPQTGIDAVTTIQLRLRPGADLNAVRDKLRAHFPIDEFPYRIQTWRDMQGPLLAAVQMETTLLNILLFLIIAVAGFGILATFFMIVVEKTRDIGILKALGAPSRGVMSIFLNYGFSLGLVGSGVGLVGGLLFVIYINDIAKLIEIVTGQEVFDPTVYYFERIPTDVQPLAVVSVVFGAVLIAVLASVLPALRAARLHPVEALRYE